MSYSFYAQGPAPDFDLLRTFSAPLCVVGMEPGELPAGRFQDGEVLHVYQRGVTTRSVEIAYEQGAFSARVLTLACSDDYRIALHLVCEAARRSGGDVETEEGVRFAPDDVDVHCGPGWVRDHIATLVGMTVQMTQKHGEVSMLGAGVHVHLDVPTLDRVLGGLEDPSERADALFDVFRAVNYPPEAYYPANLMEVALEDGTKQTLVACVPTVAYQFPRADLVGVEAGGGLMIVPWQRFCDVAGVRLLDAATVRMEAIGEDEWPAFLERLRPYQTDFGGPEDEEPRSSAPSSATETSMVPSVGSVAAGLVVGALLLLLQAPIWVAALMSVVAFGLVEGWTRRTPQPPTVDATKAVSQPSESEAAPDPEDAPDGEPPLPDEPGPEEPPPPSVPSPPEEVVPHAPADRPSAADLLRQMKGGSTASDWTANLRHFHSLVYSERDRERLWRRAHRGDAGAHRLLSTIDVPTAAEGRVLERLVADLGSGR